MSEKNGLVILVCGRLGCGKTTYSEQMAEKSGGLLLSVDDLMLRLFGQEAGDEHDGYVKSIKEYLLEQAVRLSWRGIPVYLDWGFWSRKEREETRAYFAGNDVPCRLHYLNIRGDEYARRVAERNRQVLSGETTGVYYVDEALAQKAEALFEEPAADEIDVLMRS